MERDYYSALGRFIEQFAKVECELHDYVIHLAGLTRETGLAILSGSRVDADISSVRRLHEVAGKKQSALIERVLAQLSLINSTRNMLLHYGTSRLAGWDEDGRPITVQLASDHRRSMRKPRMEEVSAETLASMHHDVNMMTLVFLALTRPKAMGKFGGSLKAARAAAKAFLVEAEQTPWRYKSQQLKLGSPPGTKAKKPQHQPRSFRA